MKGMHASIRPIEAHDTEFDRVLDIRPHAMSTPTIPGAVAVTVEQLLSDPSRFIDSTSHSVLVVCDIGLRSDAVTRSLRSAGYASAVSLDGGIEEWIAQGLATAEPEGLSPGEYVRYDRQLKLPWFGIAGQQALRDARVAIVGVGGLGSPVLGYLAAAGIGHLTIIDSDRVEISNLHRQPIYTMSDVGGLKSEAAASYAKALNPTIEIAQSAVPLDTSNAVGLLRGHDVVVTCTDSFATAQAINSAAVDLGIPMVFGSVYRTEGQMSVFDARSGPCYACVFPDQSGGPNQDCSIVGVLGAVTGVVGSMQAAEVVKLLAGSTSVNKASLVMYDAQSQSIDAVTLRKRPSCAVCGE
jgi:molybdopterin/thiamine biosynthesis adenylyltransferase